MENVKKYNEIFVEVFSVDLTDLNGKFDRDSVANWDSIHQLNLISYIEEVFDIMFDVEDVLGFTSYAKGKDILSSKYEVIF